MYILFELDNPLPASRLFLTGYSGVPLRGSATSAVPLPAGGVPHIARLFLKAGYDAGHQG
jgi:hypothetical protein